jgi:CheY-like chemotaxis protein
LAALKSDPDTAEIPVILVTIADDKNLGYALGAVAYLTKPVEREQLLAAIESCRRANDAGQPPLAPGTGSPGRVLVVEDDPAVRTLVRRTLEGQHWSVTEAENGRVGIEQLAGRPDLIVLDLMMPEMDGFAFIEALRRRPDTERVPVVVLTAKDLTDDDRRRLNGSVERILRKGEYTRDQLLAEVTGLVRSRCRPA